MKDIRLFFISLFFIVRKGSIGCKLETEKRKTQTAIMTPHGIHNQNLAFFHVRLDTEQVLC